MGFGSLPIMNAKQLRELDVQLMSFLKDLVEPMGRRLESLGLVTEGILGQWPVKLLEAGKVFEAMHRVPHDEPELLRRIDPSMAGVFF